MTTAILSTPAAEVKSTPTPTVSPEQEAARQLGRDINTLCDAERAIRRFGEVIKRENGLRPEQVKLLDSMVRDVVKGIRRVFNYRMSSRPVAVKVAMAHRHQVFMFKFVQRRGPDGKRLGPN